MKNNLKFLVIGLLIGVIIATSSVFAITGVVEKSLEYNNIKIKLNGQEITPTDANGNYVEPFTIDGTTYLPVRAIAGALDLEVGWDEETSTVILGKDTSASSAEGTVIYDNHGLKITYTGMEYSGIFEDPCYNLQIENNSDRQYRFDGNDIYVDGYATDGFTSFMGSLDPGKKQVDFIRIDRSILDRSGISQVETIEFDLRIMVINPYGIDEEFAKETITFCP